jgi:hypothetical protein
MILGVHSLSIMSLPAIMTIGLLVAGGGTIISMQIAVAQNIDNNSTGSSLGNPFLKKAG